MVQSEEDAVLKYVSGLNSEVRYAAIHIAGWSEASTVAEKQALAIQGQKIVDEIAEMGGKKKTGLYQHPNASNQTPTPIQINKPVVIHTSNSTPMEIDAIVTKNDKRNPFPAIRSICVQNSLCF